MPFNSAACYSIVGIILIVCGVLSVIFNIVDLAVIEDLDFPSGTSGSYKTVLRYQRFQMCSTGYIGHGFWCGIMCVVTGVFGFLASKGKTRNSIFTFMVLSIIAGALCIGQFIAGAIGASRGNTLLEGLKADDEDWKDHYCKPKIIIAMEALLAILAIIGGVMAAIGAIISCQDVGCCSDGAVGAPQVMTTHHQQQQVTTTVTTAGPHF